MPDTDSSAREDKFTWKPGDIEILNGDHVSDFENDVERILDAVRRHGVDKDLKPPEPYEHMGALITDCILQAGMRWKTVEGRVAGVMAKNGTETTSGFLAVLERDGPEKVLGWSGAKPQRALTLTIFLKEHHLETVAALHDWLLSESNVRAIGRLPGFGDKTKSYIQILTGIPAFAIDVHLEKFARLAGVIDHDDHPYVERVCKAAADRLETPYDILDRAIWRWASAKGA